MQAGRRLLPWLLAAVALPAAAIDYRSVAAPVAVLYDTPSAKGGKLYLLKQYTPLEIVVRLEGWIKVRDVEGTLAWVDAKLLSERRMVVVTSDRAEIRKEANANAAIVFEAEKWVALELVEPAQAGWARVRHLDGSLGYVRAPQVWGL
ncbi:MAG TPA: SH3 domain-containing protein [Rhodocyclaceae bacterium]|nr:SH3 domain-containing protein [Rhodocyclaceae bacterium]